MPRNVVLLRGVNVGKHNRIAMGDFAAALEAIGCADVSTYLQSGNAVVEAPTKGLADRVQAALRERCSLDVPVVVRTARELAKVVEANPFPERTDEPKMLHVAFLDGDLDPEIADGVSGRHGDDELAVGDRALYLSFTTGSHRSPLNAVVAKLPVTATARNWSTVTALLDMAQ